MIEELDTVLTHHGVKGMKWGVRRKSQNASNKPRKQPLKRVKEEWKSASRERQWRKIIKEVDNMSTKEINTVAGRVRMENSLKKLSKTKRVGSSKDRADYRRRAEMSNEELSRKVNRLRAKESLIKSASQASQGQIDFGKKVVSTAGPLALKYVTGQKITPKDLFDSATNPKKAKNDTMDDFFKKNPSYKK